MLRQQPTDGLTAQVGWLDLRVCNRLMLFCIHQINRGILVITLSWQDQNKHYPKYCYYDFRGGPIVTMRCKTTSPQRPCIYYQWIVL